MREAHLLPATVLTGGIRYRLFAVGRSRHERVAGTDAETGPKGELRAGAEQDLLRLGPEAHAPPVSVKPQGRSRCNRLVDKDVHPGRWLMDGAPWLGWPEGGDGGQREEKNEQASVHPTF